MDQRIENVSPQWGSNSRPLVYKTSALATELWRQMWWNITFIVTNIEIFHNIKEWYGAGNKMYDPKTGFMLGSPLQLIIPYNMYNAMAGDGQNPSPQWGSNSRPLVYETSALSTELWRHPVAVVRKHWHVLGRTWICRLTIWTMCGHYWSKLIFEFRVDVLKIKCMLMFCKINTSSS